jgi:hypothetical protein
MPLTLLLLLLLLLLCSSTGLPMQLPDFLWQSVNIIAAAEQPLLRLPLCAAVRLIKAVVRVCTHVDCANALGIKWSWAADTLQQLLNFAVAAGLVRALPLGTTAEAFLLYKDGSSMAGSSSSCRMRYVEAVIPDIITCATSLLCFAESKLHDKKENIPGCTAAEKEELQEICHHFTNQPVVAEVALQLLASRCMLVSYQLQAVQQQRLQQQQSQLLPQPGKRMRGDLLLLSNPQPRLIWLLPADAFLRADAAVMGVDSSSSSSSEVGMFSVDAMADMVLLLQLQLLALKAYGRSHNSSAAASLLTLSGPALQLLAELLLLAAVHWQQLYHSLTGWQQLLLNLPKAELTEARDGQLASAQMLLVYTLRLLQLQVEQLWNDGQWQPQMQLLQQGSGKVLLQGLTLFVHCSSLDSELRNIEENKSWTLSAIMSMLAELVSVECQHLQASYRQQRPRQHAVTISEV